MTTEKNKKISIRHQSATWFLVFLMVGSFLFGENILAVGDYNKVDGSRLNPDEWNNLINDYVTTWATSTMAGPLGIGTAPSAALDIFGKLKFTSGGTIYNTDSSRYLDMTGTLSDSLRVSGNIYSTGGVLKTDGTGINYMMGNLGIGTTNPAEKLDVRGTITSENNSYTLGDGAFIAKGTNPTIVQRIQRASGGFAYALFNGYADNTTTGLSSKLLEYGAYGDMQSGATAPTISYAYFGVGGSAGHGNTHMRLYDNANKTVSFDGLVGIGTTNPPSKLTVADSNKSINSSGNLFIYTNDTATQNYGGQISLGGSYTGTSRTNFGTISGRKEYTTSGSAAGYLAFGTASSSGGTISERMRINSFGNVGIGTNNPLSKLQVAGETRVIYNITGENKIYAGQDENYGGGINYDGNNTIDKLFLFTRNGGVDTNRLSIDIANGNVGIGTVTPTTARLVINPSGTYSIDAGNGRIGNLGTPALDDDAATVGYVKSIVAGTSTIPTVGYWTANGTNIYNANAGNVGIGTTNPGSYKLYVNGNSFINGSLIVNTNTDASPFHITRNGSINESLGISVNDSITSFKYVNDEVSNRVDFTLVNTDIEAGGGVGANTSTILSLIGNAAGGSVGIGTTTPAFKLDVAGTGQFTQPVIVGTPTAANHAVTKSYFDSSIGDPVGAGTAGQTLRNDGNGWVANSVLFNNGTNVGIGTTNPSHLLQITGSNQTLLDAAGFYNTYAYGSGNTSETRINLGKIEGGNLQSMGAISAKPNSDSNSTEGMLQFYTRASSALGVRMSILNNGNVGIGTVPAYKLDIAGAGQFTQPVIVGTPTATNHAATKSYVDSAAASAAGASWTVSGNNIYNSNSGNIGIGTTAPGQKLDVSGSIRTTNQFISTVANGTAPLVVNSQTLVGNLNADLLDGIQGSVYFKDGDIVMNTNPFGGRKLYINSINNAFFKAEKRWTVVGKWYSSTDDSELGTFTQDQLSRLFDGNYENYITIPAGSYAKITITFPNEPGGFGPFYSDGNYYISNYYTYFPNVTVTNQDTLSVYGNYASQGVGLYTYYFSDFSRTSSLITRASNQRYQPSLVEYKIHANSTDSRLVTQLDVQFNRPANSEMPVVDKFKPNYLYDNLSFQNGGRVTQILLSPSGNSYINSGNVGIGTTAPAYKLDVAGTGQFTQPVIVGTPTAANHAVTKSYFDSSIGDPIGAGTTGQTLRNDGNGWVANSLFYNNGTNIGIGTTAPNKKLHIENTTTGNGIGIYDNNGSQLLRAELITNTWNGELNLYNSGNQKTVSFSANGNSYINNSGNVGIGSTAPAFKLDVAGTGQFTQPVIVGTPTAANHAVTKSYFDSAIGDPVGAGTSGQTLRNDGNGWVANSLFYNNGTNIGIGTTNPLGKLQISTLASSTWVYLQNASESGFYTRIFNNGSGNGSTVPFTKISMGHSAYGDNSSVNFYRGGATTGGFLTFTTDTDAERMRITASGNIGIGTTTPAYKLDVIGTGSFTQPVIVGTPTATNHAATKSYVDSAAASAAGASWTVSGNNIYNSNSGNVGIGTTNPFLKLDVRGAVAVVSGLNNNSVRPAVGNTRISGEIAGVNSGSLGADDGFLRLSAGGGTNATQKSFIDLSGYSAVGDMINNIVLGTNGVEIMRIVSNKIGIGTTTPAFKLDVAGTGQFTQPVIVGTPTAANHAITKSYFDSAIGDPVGSGTAGQTLRNNGTSWVANSNLFNNGTNVGIGTTNPTEKLNVVGNGLFNTTVARISLGNQGSDGDVHFGASGIGTPTNGSQDYGFYAAYNAYRSTDGNWYHSRPAGGSLQGAARFTGSYTSASGINGFRWDVSANVGTSTIPWTNLMALTTSGNLGIGTVSPSAALDIFSKLKLTSGGTIYNTDSGRWLDMTGTLTDSLKVSGDLFSTAGELKTAGTGINYMMGNLGIGTTVPGNALDVMGDISYLAQSAIYPRRKTVAADWYLGKWDGGNNINNSIGSSGNTAFQIGYWGGGTFAPNVKLSAGGGNTSYINSGNVGIGTTTPIEAKLVINAGTGEALKAYGNGIFTGTLQTQTGSDFAEEFITSGNLEPGTVVVMDDNGHKSVKPCAKSYDKTVVGIVSNDPSIIAGRVNSKHKAIIAMMGVVKVKVSNINGNISKGDLLTTSGIYGYAMKALDTKPGTVIGKALENLSKSTGEINVLVNLQ